MKCGWILAIVLPTACLACASSSERDSESFDSNTEEVPTATRAIETKVSAEESDEILVSAVGDCTLGDPVGAEAAKGSFHDAFERSGRDMARPFSGTKHILEDDDLTIANLETTLGTQRCRTDVAFAFRGAPEFAEMLRAGSVEIVNIANNHTDDCGLSGRKQTLEALARVQVGPFGFGTVDRRTIKGVEIVNLGYTGGRTEQKARIMREIQREKRDDNLVFVSFHWGKEGSRVILPEQQILGRAAIDAGADLVIGHHPHVLQGIETYKGRRIVYSLGNFVFGGNSKPDNMDSMIFQARFRKEGPSVRFVEDRTLPVSISSVNDHNDFRPMILDGEARARVLRDIEAMRISSFDPP